MCGIVGFWNIDTLVEDPMSLLECMTTSIIHRGPDDSGHMYDAKSGIGLGHRRLSILDLSPEGSQPMNSVTGRYSIVFNGEIYNFKTLRQALQNTGTRFRGNSDTEVMLACLEAWGIEESLNQFNGMFAFALWDRQKHVLHLVRDRLGIKPLYYGWVGSLFVFGSDLRSIKALPSFTNEIDRGGVSLFLRHSYVPAPYTIYKGIRKMLPGNRVEIKFPEVEQWPISNAYWKPSKIITYGKDDLYEGSVDDAVGELQTLLRDSVDLRMISDVPLGAFLSGGVDSSLVVSLMQEVSDVKAKTFSIGFEENGFNEAGYAKEIAKHLGTEHSEIYVSSLDCLDVIPDLPQMFSEPFSDSSQIPTYLVSKLARQNMTVALSGDGGDELFAGYSRYHFANTMWNKLENQPGWLRNFIAKGIRTTPIRAWDLLGGIATVQLQIESIYNLIIL